MTSLRLRLGHVSEAPRSGHGLRRHALSLTAGSLALLAPLTALAPAVAAVAPVTADDATILLTSIGPAAVTPDDDLVVTGRVTNSAAAALPALRLTLRLDTRLLVERSDVRTWTTRGEVDDDVRRLPGAASVPGLAPGSSAAFTITVPAGDLGLPRSRTSFGPRGIAVEATAGDARAGLTRSTIVWYPGKEFQPTKLTLLAPFTAPRDTNPAAPDEGLAAALTPGGSLGRTLEATSDPLIGWALDPALLAAAQTLAADPDETGEDASGDGEESGGATPTPTGTDGSTSEPSRTTTPEEREAAEEWLDAVRDGRQDRDLVTLPYGDPDLTAVTRSAGGGMLRAADELAADVTRSLFGTALTPDVAWPAGGAVDQATLATLRRSGRRAVILGSATQPLTERVDHTSTGRSTITVGPTTLDGLLYDEQLSTLFGATGGGQGAAATQQLIAELAAVTLERPGDSRNMFAVAPRGWDPDPAGVEAAMTALRTTPWITLRTLNDLRGTNPPDAREAPRYTPKARAAELPRSHVTTTNGLFGDITRFGPALLNPAPVIEPLRQRLLMFVSAAWRTDRPGLGAARGPLARDVRELTGGVHIVRSSDRPYFLASRAALPVYVANGTPYPVKVVVTLKPRSGSLVIEKPVEIELDPYTRRQQVLVPTRALASGDVQIAASVRTADGTQIGSERELVVQVRREWETRGIIGAGSVLAVLLAIGLLRGVRRDRPRVRPEDVPDVDDLASAAGDRAAARRDAIEEAAAARVEDDATPMTEGDREARTDSSHQEAQSGHAVASPDSAAGGVARQDDEPQDRPVMSREQR